MWLQTQRDVTLERQRAPGLSPRREDPHEFRVGRLKHERVKVPRGEQLLEWAMQVMRIHADRKSILEVHCHFCFISVLYQLSCARIAHLDIGSCCRLNSLAIESQWRQDFSHVSRLTLGPTQHPIQWVLGLFPRSNT